jgi:hypothetical protein
MLTHYTEKGKDITEGVYTLNEFLAAADQPAALASNADPLSAFKAERQLDWMGLEGEAKDGETAFACSTRLVKDGYRKGLDLIQKVKDKVTAPTPKTVRRYQKWMAQGDDVEMQRIWSGNLDYAWRGTARDTRHGPQRVRILVDAIESGGNGAAGMRWRGVAALKLSDLLTEAGYSVQVESVISCKDSSSSRIFKLRTIVKEYEQPLDLLTLAATTTLPAFFRSLMHTWGLAVAINPRCSVSYQVRTPDAEEFPDGDDNSRVFVIPGKANNAEKASELITQIIGKLDEAGE